MLPSGEKAGSVSIEFELEMRRGDPEPSETVLSVGDLPFYIGFSRRFCALAPPRSIWYPLWLRRLGRKGPGARILPGHAVVAELVDAQR